MYRSKAWKQWERDIAKDINGIRIYFSGAMSKHFGLLTGDATNDFYLVEAKYSGAKNKKGQIIKIQREWLSKVEKEAKQVGKIPILAFRYKKIQVKGCFIKLNQIKWRNQNNLSTTFQKMVDRALPYKEKHKALTIEASWLSNLGIYQVYEDWVVIPWQRFLEYGKETNTLVGTETKKQFAGESIDQLGKEVAKYIKMLNISEQQFIKEFDEFRKNRG